MSGNIYYRWWHSTFIYFILSIVSVLRHPAVAYFSSSMIYFICVCHFLYVFAILLSLFLYSLRSVFYMYDYKPIVSVGPSVRALPSLSDTLLFCVVLFLSGSFSQPLIFWCYYTHLLLLFSSYLEVQCAQ